MIEEAISKVVVDKEQLESLKKKYPSVSDKEFESFVGKNCKYFSKMDQDRLERFGFKEGKKQEFFDKIKEMITFIQEDYVAPVPRVIQSGEETIEEGPKIKNPFKNLHYSTEHLPLYHEFNSLIGLYGRHYIPVVKTRWYQLFGGILQTEIHFGNVHTDTRIHACYPIVTEGGKNDIIYGIKSLVERGIKKRNGDFYTISEPISFHQESLIGKRVERMIDNPLGKPKKIKTTIENRGHLANDFVDFDECNSLMNSNAPDFQQAREYLSKAENSMGRNKVEKRSVDDLKDEGVSYYPVSTHSYFFQPFKKLPEEFILQGFGRRKIIPIGNISNFLVNPTETLYSQKLQGRDFNKSEYEERLCNYLEIMAKKIQYFTLTEKALELINQTSMYIWGQAQLHSEKISNFSKVSKWTAMENMVKMSCILAGAYYQNVVTEHFVLFAFMDLVELMQNTYDFIYEKIIGEFDYGTTWGGANFKQKEALKYLYSQEAFSKESSSVTIPDFLDRLVEIFRVQEAQARNRMREMKQLKLIDSAQIGQNSSAVWLNIRPDEYKTYLEGDKGDKGYTLYNSVFLGKNSILTQLKSLTPLTPLTDFPPEIVKIKAEHTQKEQNEGVRVLTDFEINEKEDFENEEE